MNQVIGADQGELFGADREAAAYLLTWTPSDGPTALESAAFPFERISDIAEVESWRKEINRPIYHIHKWWAQRLGSVFRSIVLGTFSPATADLFELFYRPVRLDRPVVFDPFMGSGTTIGETLKLGGRAIGRDINPVAAFLVRNAVGMPSRNHVLKTFHDIERDVASDLTSYYRSEDGSTVLYFFWVKRLPCPACRQDVDLFSSYVFAQHAYPGRFPDAKTVCPSCGTINTVPHDSTDATCSACSHCFDPSAGPAQGRNATCACGTTFAIASRARELGTPPAHRLYAKLVLTASGAKEYQAADDFDQRLYERAAAELAEGPIGYPVVAIAPGYNTDQVLNYSYRYWHEMFNARQLLCLGKLAARIRTIPDPGLRDLFCCLFSGLLEFNNMFASFKGEGTGAVRHMFYHHILKPERTPLEANPWGVKSGSSGSFLTVFDRRLLRALDYAENPFELRVAEKGGRKVGAKVFDLSAPLSHRPASTATQFEEGRAVYLSCGDSAATDLPTASVDAVITDPPFFDNVHYSQLADFFFVWQQFVLEGGVAHDRSTTRSSAEVQNSDAVLFGERLTAVWKECHRVLRPRGLLAFTYHHSRPEGWACVLESLRAAGFVVTHAFPIKAEMSVATPKHQAKEPIDLDMVMVCRKRSGEGATVSEAMRDEAIREASSQVGRLRSAGRSVSRNDVRVIVMAQVVARLSRAAAASTSDMVKWDDVLEVAIHALHADRGSAQAKMI